MPADPAFAPVPAEPDHVALEHRVLELWDRDGTFDRLRKQNEGGPTLEVTGIASVGRQRVTPLVRRNYRVQLSDTISYFRAAHHVKFGADVGRVFFPEAGNILGSTFGGRYIFSAIPPLGVTSSLDGLQKGIPAAYIQGYGNPHYPDEGYGTLALFVQDEWARGRLSLCNQRATQKNRD